MSKCLNYNYLYKCMENVSLCINLPGIKGTLQAKYKFTLLYRTLHDAFRGAIRFFICVLVYEVHYIKLFIA